MTFPTRIPRSLPTLQASSRPLVRARQVRPQWYSTSRNRLVLSRQSCRRFTTTSRTTTSTTTTSITIHSTPPMAVRVPLVATTTAITTHFVLLFYWNEYILLPFAVVNGGLAGTAYGLLDVVAAGPVALAQMRTGAAIGGLVGLVGPACSLYDRFVGWCFDLEAPEDNDGDEGRKYFGLSDRIWLSLSVPTGIFLGHAIQIVLEKPLVGIPGVHWTRLSGPLLAATTLFSFQLYLADYFNKDIFPPEAFVTEEEKQYVGLVPRLHPKRLEVKDWGPGEGYHPSGTGNQARERVLGKLKLTKEGERYTDLVFASKRKAWLHYMSHGEIGEEYGIGYEHIPSKSDVSRESQKYATTDVAVAFALMHGQESKRDTAKGLREKAMALVMDQPETTRGVAKLVGQIELASYGIAILWELKRTAAEHEMLAHEKAIRKLAPGIILYRTEEEKETKGCSVESQLDAFGWKGIGGDEKKRCISRIWESGLQKIQSANQAKASKQQLLLGGLGVMIFYTFSGGR